MKDDKLEKMQIGILLADDVREVLTPHFGDYPSMFHRLLNADSENHNTFQVRVFDVQRGEYPQNIDDCDGYLITGSRYGVYEDCPWIPSLLAYIRALDAAQYPLVGICFGHQAIAQALGGKAEKSPKSWGVGLHSWPIHAQAPWMHPCPPMLSLLCSHQDQVSKLPDNATLLAGNDFCPNAMYCINQHIFCTQGHPEFSPEFLRALWDYRCNLEPHLRPQYWQQAADSGSTPNDNDLFARWLAMFFAQVIMQKRNAGQKESVRV